MSNYAILHKGLFIFSLCSDDDDDDDDRIDWLHYNQEGFKVIFGVWDKMQTLHTSHPNLNQWFHSRSSLFPVLSINFS